MNEDNVLKLDTVIRESLAPSLRADGFAGSGRTFRRVRNAWVQVVNIQGAREGGRFAINLGLQPLAIPDALGNAPEPKRLTESLCEFRRRLAERGADQWWSHAPAAESLRAAVSAAARVYVETGRPLLDRLATPDMPMNTVTPDDFAHGRYDFSGFAATMARMALALARLRQAQGQVAASVAFARLGLTHCGDGATGLRRDLEALIPPIPGQ
ncbi:hypothetical protein GQ57_20495 [Burkholderia sp. MSh2]|uniref:DUF4304 domain-containing protein n=1 Tax=Burkholderia paludis TaxID=1506587 RepID=A0A6P2LCH7_9BURK|nr:MULTISPECIES: DUF4304 domain-containing protein [Burkholderia]KEZ04071.1 hypothetical protein GQ57_20495 [Burkholderia sp. MSh2]CAB3753016.1 hypothetical protein LMG30113_01846 [Burkholderia paludis]VWB64862.1 hypothetical protein BPA30113_02893 [Burkholderia paludis]